DAIGGEQPLAAQLGPVTIGIRRQQFGRRQRRCFLTEDLFGPRQGQTEERRAHGSTLEEFTTVEHGRPPQAANRQIPSEKDAGEALEKLVFSAAPLATVPAHPPAGCRVRPRRFFYARLPKTIRDPSA